MLVEKDSMHINLRPLNGYNKPFNYIVCEREAGKSTELVSAVYNDYKKGKTSLLFKRNIVDITEEYINSLLEIIHKFYDESFIFKYNKQSLKDGVISIKDKDDKLIFMIVALSVKISKLKSLVLRNVSKFHFDEFICNPKFGEKYLKAEADKFKEVYNTFYREATEMIKCYFYGNPYSMHNPYFMWHNVDLKQLKKGEIYAKDNYAIWCYEITPELREYILKRNPLYQFDDSYKKYAFFGQAVNDENIRLGTLPVNYSLKWIFKVDGKYIAVYKNNYVEDLEDRFFCKIEDNIGWRRNVYCYDFNEMMEKTALIDREDREKFARFKRALQRNLVTFESINVYYIVIEIYNFI